MSGSEPSDEHRRITRTVGVWDVACKYFASPSEPIETKAVESIEQSGMGGVPILKYAYTRRRS